MKRITLFALAFALCTACEVSALAADATSGTTNPTSGATEITTSIKPSYTVKIPAATKIGFNNTVTELNAPLYLETAQLDPDYKVTISATPNDLKTDADNIKTIPFTLHEGEKTFSSADFFDTKKQVKLSVHITEDAWNKAPADSYTGSVTFKIAYGK